MKNQSELHLILHHFGLFRLYIECIWIGIGLHSMSTLLYFSIEHLYFATISRVIGLNASARTCRIMAISQLASHPQSCLVVCVSDKETCVEYRA